MICRPSGDQSLTVFGRADGLQELIFTILQGPSIDIALSFAI